MGGSVGGWVGGVGGGCVGGWVGRRVGWPTHSPTHDGLIPIFSQIVGVGSLAFVSFLGGGLSQMCFFPHNKNCQRS